MVLINDKKMTFNKPYALLCFLLCFCFLSTSLAQPCLAETNVSNGYYGQLELEDNHEPSALLCSHLTIKRFDKPSLLIVHPPLESLNLQRLPCCNRDPPAS